MGKEDVGCGPPGSSVHGIFQAGTLEWVAIAFSRRSSQPRDQTLVSCIPGISFTIWATREVKDVVKTDNGIFSLVAQSCLTLCDPMNRSTPGLPVHHQLPEFTQTHVHRVGDAIQPSHLLSSPSPPAPTPPSIRVFFNESALRMRWPKYWSFSFSISPSNEHPGLSSFRMDWLDLLAVQGTQESSPTPQFKSINFSALSCLHSPTLASICDNWKNHTLD